MYLEQLLSKVWRQKRMFWQRTEVQFIAQLINKWFVYLLIVRKYCNFSIVWSGQSQKLTLPVLFSTFKNYYCTILQHKTTIFVLHQSKALDQSFPMVSWLMFESKTWPQTSQSPILTLPLLADENLQRHQPTPPGAETITSICSWFELSVYMVSAPEVVGWWCCVKTT